jgi:predicted AlkP superfamily pyrophosphatase or phosphodiesterase
MKRYLLPLVLLVSAASVWTIAVRAANRPKLIVAIVVDQFRYDYLTRFRSDYKAGFDRLLTKGAVFTEASYIHSKTVTAIGHSTFLSGATPSTSGIVGNEWYDRTLGRVIQSVSDPAVKTVGRPPAAVGASGGSGRGGRGGRAGVAGASGASGSSGRLPTLAASPRNLIVSTVGDELKMRYPGSHVIGVSIKDRAAIMPAGHMADGAYWFADDVKRWVTSSYYRDQLPPWVVELNSQVEKRNFVYDWLPLGAAPGSVKPFCQLLPGPPEPELAEGETRPPAPPRDPRSCGNIESTPIGNELIEEFAEKAVAAENLGGHDTTDILTVSFSSNDYVGHAVGPDAPEVRDISIRTDILLGKMMDYINSRVGADNVIYVLTADHGVSPAPEANLKRGMPGGRLSAKVLTEKITAALSQRWGEGKWLISGDDYLNLDLIAARHLDRSEVERVAAEAIRSEPHIARVYTRTQLQSGSVTGDPIGRAFTLDFFAPRSPDLFILPEPYWIFSTTTTGSTHGTPYWYDAHVPVIFMGPGIKPGSYTERIAPNDIAPTLSHILGVEMPNGSSGRILTEILDDAPVAPAPVAAGAVRKSRGATAK